MMFRILEISLLILVLAAGIHTFYVKNQSENRLAEIRQLETDIRSHENAIDLLEADWSLLNQPNRVQKLVEAFQEQLKLDVTEPEQIVQSSELPRVRPEPDPMQDEIADAIKTGSVE